jgi:hypothetical protein
MKEENTYIKNLEGAYLLKAVNIKTKNKKDEIKLFSATMPYSIEIKRLNEYFPKEIYSRDNKQYTDEFINVKFSEDYFIMQNNRNEDAVKYIVNKVHKKVIFKVSDCKKIKRPKKKKNIIMHKKKIRDYIYINGFYIGEQHYRFYKRGSSKAKTGTDIFCKAELYDKLINRSRLGIKFSESTDKKDREECDITSLHAYQSLIMSSLATTIKLYPNEILMLDDIYGKKFESIASVTRWNEKTKKLETKTEEHFWQQNCLTDGQGLMEESVFQEYKKLQNKGMALLRSDFFKCCAFNTKLHKYWKNQEQEVAEIVEKLDGIPTGRILKTSEIKLVITPNSLKWLKFAYKEQFNGDRIKCYLHWLNNIDEIFGVVKYDKQGNYGNYNRTTYQLLNSMPLSKLDIKELIQPEIDYVMDLKNNISYFKNYINYEEKDSIQLSNYVQHNSVLEFIEDKYSTKDMLSNLLLINENIRYTQQFKDFKKEQINHYEENLRHGKIRLKDTIYATIVSNPYEMLQATIGKYKQGKCIAEGREVWCSYYKDKDIQEFCLSRNPHINGGNVIYAVSKFHDEYDWFNLTDNIMICNFNDNDFPARAQGCDTDSDTILILPALSSKAKDCEEDYPTPINMVKGEKKIRYNTMKDLAKLDNVLANGYTGKIVNKSQIMNSYMHEAIAEGASKKVIDKLYEASSLLSSLSQIELDKSKKSFDNISMAKELGEINHIKDENDREILKFKKYTLVKWKNGKRITKKVKLMIVPNFFNVVAEDNTYRTMQSFDTPMDYLQEILDKEIHKPKPMPKLTFKDLLVKKAKNLGGKSNSDQVNDLWKIIGAVCKKLNGLEMNKSLDDKSKKNIRISIKKKAIEALQKKKINSNTILLILKKAFGLEAEKGTNYKKYGLKVLNLLYYAKQFETLACFLNTDTSSEEVLLPDENGEINIFGTRYSGKVRKEISESA